VKGMKSTPSTATYIGVIDNRLMLGISIV